MDHLAKPENLCSVNGCHAMRYSREVTTCKVHCGKINTDKKVFKHLQGVYAFEDIMEAGQDAQIKDLRPEIAVARVIQARALKSAKNDNELLALAPAVSDLLNRTQSLVSAHHKIEQDSGNSLTGDQVREFCQYIIEDVSAVLNDLPDKHKRIAQLAELLNNSLNRILGKGASEDE